MIGIAKRILNSMLLQHASTKLTHEVLTTFLAEVAAIVNDRPLVPVSTDPEDPVLLTPSTLLTQKIGSVPAPTGDFTTKDVSKQQWRHVNILRRRFGTGGRASTFLFCRPEANGLPAFQT